jgi:hypothetical protein
VLSRIGDEWWRLGPRRAPQCEDLVAVGVGTRMDVPRLVALDGERRLHDGSEMIAFDVIPGALRVVAGGHATAWSVDELWHVRGPGVKPATISVDEECEVIGMVVEGRRDDPALVTRSKAGVLLRLHTETGMTTLTRWSGVAVAHAVHPLLPLIAVQRDEGTVEVGEVESGDLLTTVHAE